MKAKFHYSVTTLALLGLWIFSGVLQAQPNLPHLSSHNDTIQLVVHDEPFLVLGGELGNSTSTSRSYMEPIWPDLVDMNLNTVLAVVPWGMVEPEEDAFDFSMVDGLISDAREHDLKLVLLWFGSWKNGLSHYVPEWVKQDRERFPYVETRHGTLEILSPFSEANLQADKKAFTAFMQHLREVDSEENTVIMIQVQNEVGVHADSRDRSQAATAAYRKDVPAELLANLDQRRDRLRPHTRTIWRSPSGSWDEVFGLRPQAEEAFMAWHYGRYIDAIAAAGKAEYPLPMFVNAWIVQPDDEQPGDYPSGGPQAHMLDIWQAAAEHIDIFAPDIYLPNYQEICEQFVQPDNPLFVPESRAGVQGMAQAYLTFGRFDGIGYSPFGIERHVDNFAGYDVLQQLAPLILEHQGSGRIHAASLTEGDDAESFVIGDHQIEVDFLSHWRRDIQPERAYAMVIAIGADEYIVSGSGAQVIFTSATSEDQTIGLARVEEGRFEDGEWLRGRILSGDEIMISYDMADMAAQRRTGTALKFQEGPPTIQRVRLYRYAHP